MDITPFLNKFNDAILNPIILLLFGIAFVVFFIGLFQFIRSAGDGAERDTGKKKIVYGLIGMLIMFSAYGLIHVVLGTFGLKDPAYLSQ
ncbi:hypothetical protein KW800_02580 [Candidatus Parcubacteria bacterium]|nr:hypothetical protein [Candidatus Parcubacteria bacterium]